MFATEPIGDAFDLTDSGIKLAARHAFSACGEVDERGYCGWA